MPIQNPTNQAGDNTLANQAAQAQQTQAANQQKAQVAEDQQSTTQKKSSVLGA
jgi:hypothetical protein